MSTPIDLASTSEVAPQAPDVARTPKEVVASVDFAVLIGGRVLVYGWVLEFKQSVRSASIDIGSTHVDLALTTVHVRRPDVSKHFSMAPGNDDHGFYVLVDLPDDPTSVDKLKLSVTLLSGERSESTWPIVRSDGDTSAVIGPHVTTLCRLLPELSKTEAARLIDFAKPVLGTYKAKTYEPPLSIALQLGIDLCCILEKRLLVIAGWLSDPLRELTSAAVQINGLSFNLPEYSVFFAHPDVQHEIPTHAVAGANDDGGFLFVCLLPEPLKKATEATFAFSSHGLSESLVRSIMDDSREALHEIMQIIKTLDAEPAFLFAELALREIGKAPEQSSLKTFFGSILRQRLDSLPVSVEQAKPRYFLHVDQAIPIADKGLFLIGWFNADPQTAVRILCHCGGSSFSLTETWVRHARPDVSSHLANLGIPTPDTQHGFSCYVPLRGGDEVHYLSTETVRGKRNCMRLEITHKSGSTIDTVRALLTSFDNGRHDLRYLMDSHIGPAVKAVWKARQRPSLSRTVIEYGARPEHPSTSILVPLYGRHDFAEYQMALFADDPEFQTTELIYIVDDPRIFADFKKVCPDLYGMFQVPFTVVSSGVNLGFAGANNFGASFARGKYLLFLNSDVLPRRAGWVGEMTHIYESTPEAGAVGAKLMYEDGSIQHAGMTFRQHPGWDNFWINDHPYKGQSPRGLDGVREAAAVTAACVLTSADLFRALGGFSEDYIIGDFEDSDLCLRLRSIGKRSFVALDVELYHLERQSQNRVGDDRWRSNLTLMNCWLHNSLWSETIEKLVAENPSWGAQPGPH